MKARLIFDIHCKECGSELFVDASEKFNKIDTGNGIIYWKADNLSDQQKMEEFANTIAITNSEPTLL